MKRRWQIRAALAAGLAGLGLLAAEAARPLASEAEGDSADRARGHVRYVPDNLHAVSFVNMDDGWAAGHYGTMLQTTDGGLSWLRRSMPQNDLIRRTRFIDDRAGWAVSHRGQILFTQDGGSNWVVQHEMPGVYLRDIAMADREHGWAVGHDKTILRTVDGGKTWDSQTFEHQTQDPPRLNGVAAYDPMNAIVVGEFGLIVATSDGGRTWTRLPSPVPTTYSAVAVAKDHAVAVGLGGGVVYIPRGGVPRLVPTASALHLFDVALDFAGNGFAVGAGTAYRISGEGLTPVPIRVPGGPDLVWLGGVSLLPDGRAVAVGSRGLLIRYNPIARSFTKMPDWTH